MLSSDLRITPNRAPPRIPTHMNTRQQLDWKRQTCEHACVHSESMRYMHPPLGVEIESRNTLLDALSRGWCMNGTAVSLVPNHVALAVYDNQSIRSN